MAAIDERIMEIRVYLARYEKLTGIKTEYHREFLDCMGRVAEQADKVATAHTHATDAAIQFESVPISGSGGDGDRQPSFSEGSNSEKSLEGSHPLVQTNETGGGES